MVRIRTGTRALRAAMTDRHRETCELLWRARDTDSSGGAGSGWASGGASSWVGSGARSGGGATCSGSRSGCSSGG